MTTDYSMMQDDELNEAIWQRSVGDKHDPIHDYLRDDGATWRALIEMPHFYMSNEGYVILACAAGGFWGEAKTHPSRAAWIAWLKWKDSQK